MKDIVTYVQQKAVRLGHSFRQRAGRGDDITAEAEALVQRHADVLDPNDEENIKIAKEFIFCDANADRELSIKEITKVLRRLGTRPEKHEVCRLLITLCSDT